MADTIEVLSLVPLGAGARARIEAVDPRVRLTSAPGWFDGEIADTWGPYVAASYLPSVGSGERDPAHFVPELSRRARGFPAWAMLKHLGRAEIGRAHV